jgi:hypothetical protein
VVSQGFGPNFSDSEQIVGSYSIEFVQSVSVLDLRINVVFLEEACDLLGLCIDVDTTHRPNEASSNSNLVSRAEGAGVTL